jgi:hypothetical protein
MNTSYKIIKEYGLLVQKYTGIFCFDELFDHIKIVVADPDWKNVGKIITDLRDIDLNVFYENMDFFLKYRNDNIKNSYLNVFIVDKPLPTAIVHMYKEQLNSEKYKYEYCSTVGYALSFLGLVGFEEEIGSVLDEL